MYSALIALNDPTQQALAATTIGQAYAARKVVDPQLATIARSVNDRASLDLVGRIRRELREYDESPSATSTSSPICRGPAATRSASWPARFGR
jgi:hypothetical protein